jgi:hypothetical protein
MQYMFESAATRFAALQPLEKSDHQHSAPTLARSDSQNGALSISTPLSDALLLHARNDLVARRDND